ncbi:MAG: hypothetical protein ABGZ17_20435, partial [Planctomycetaceae bacterium]
MRLTLRTLLAYLDDILEPAQAKEIGQKIDESDCASTLVRRVRDVVRRRRLTAPDIDGPGVGLDPNIVAEYLDNTLSSSSVTDVEKVCLDSDIHLAEVAACHQILTLVLGEAVDVPESTRSRMYMLGPTMEANALEVAAGRDSHKAPQPSTGKSGEAAAETAMTTKATPSTFEDSVPDYLRRKSGWSRVLPYLLVSIIAAVWLGSLVLDENVVPIKIWGFGRSDETSNLVALSDAGESGQSAAAKSTAAKLEPTTPGVDGRAGDAPKLETQGIDPQPPQDEPGTGLPGDGPPAVPVAQSPQLPSSATPKTPSRAVVPPGPVAPLPQPVAPIEPDDENKPQPKSAVVASESPPFVAHAMGGQGVLLGWNPKRENWHVQAQDVSIQNVSQIVVPMPFRFELRLAGTPVPLQLLGDTAVRILPPTKAAPASFELQRGQILIAG